MNYNVDSNCPFKLGFLNEKNPNILKLGTLFLEVAHQVLNCRDFFYTKSLQGQRVQTSHSIGLCTPGSTSQRLMTLLVELMTLT